MAMTKEYYLVVFPTENGGVKGIKIESMTKPQIEGFAKAMPAYNFAVNFAIIAGWLVKGFDEKLDIARL